MLGYVLAFALGAGVACIPWWIKVRGLKGVVSDLKDVQKSAAKVADQAKSVAKDAKL